MSFISGHTTEYVQINIPLTEARKMLNKDEQALTDLCVLIEKFVSWSDDCKRINTKRILETNWKPS